MTVAAILKHKGHDVARVAATATIAEVSKTLTARRIQANGLNMNVLIGGSGFPVLLLHGFPFTAHVWRNVATPLIAAGYQVIAPDMRGIGGTDKPVGPYHVNAVADDMVALLDVLGHKAAAVGHYACAIVFLSALAAMCLRKFARSANPLRRRIYRACGWTIVAMTVAVIVASALRLQGPEAARSFVTGSMLILWFESIAIWAFALAWLVKGRAETALTRAVR